MPFHKTMETKDHTYTMALSLNERQIWLNCIIEPSLFARSRCLSFPSKTVGEPLGTWNLEELWELLLNCFMCPQQWTMQTFIVFCLTFLCNMTFYIFCAILQFLLLHLGTDKWMCSLMRKVSICIHLPGWKTIKYPLIWYIIYLFFIKSYMKNMNLKKCLLSFFAECTCIILS